jgi:hypothetical protein
VSDAVPENVKVRRIEILRFEREERGGTFIDF